MGVWKLSMKPQKNYKSKLLSSGWMLDIKTWFARWNVDVYVDQTKTIEFNAFESNLLLAM